MKKENGITIIVLTITIIVMMILLSITISSGGDTLKTAELQAFVADCEVIQSKVDIISEKAKLDPTYLTTFGIFNGVKWKNDTLKEKFNIINLTHDIEATFKVNANPTEGQDKLTVVINLTNTDDVLYDKKNKKFLYRWEKGRMHSGYFDYTDSSAGDDGNTTIIWANEVKYTLPEGITGNIENVQQALDDLYIKAANYE